MITEKSNRLHVIMIIDYDYPNSGSPKGFTLTLQETWSIHDSMNIPKIEFIAYIYILW